MWFLVIATPRTAAGLEPTRPRCRERGCNSAPGAETHFQVYPLLRASYEGSALVYQWMYLFRRSAFFSPALRLTGMVVRRTTYEDLEEDAAARAAASSAPPLTSSSLTPVEPNGGAGGGAGGLEGGETGAPELAGELLDSGEGGGGGGGVVELLGHYGRVLLVTAVVAFKVVEWWTRVEDQVGGMSRVSFHVDGAPWCSCCSLPVLLFLSLALFLSLVFLFSLGNVEKPYPEHFGTISGVASCAVW